MRGPTFFGTTLVTVVPVPSRLTSTLHRLELPGNIIEDGRERSEYDASTQLLQIKLPKEVLLTRSLPALTVRWCAESWRGVPGP
jgi:hypothetical protein